MECPGRARPQSVKKHKGATFIWVFIALGIYNFGAAAVVTGHDDIIWQWAIISNIRHILGTRLWFWLQRWIEIFQIILHSIGLFYFEIERVLTELQKNMPERLNWHLAATLMGLIQEFKINKSRPTFHHHI